MRGPIFIILGPMEGIHIPADGLPREYELLRGKAVGSASRRHRLPFLGLILVILDNNIIFLTLFALIMVEKYIFCPACNTLTIHNRMSGQISGWICQECNPPLEDWS